MIADVRIFLYFFYQCMYSIHVYTGSETDVYEKEGQRKGGMSKRGGIYGFMLVLRKKSYVQIYFIKYVYNHHLITIDNYNLLQIICQCLSYSFHL